MGTITILAALSQEGDHESLRNILGQPGLNLQFVRTFQEALAALGGSEIEIVISESRFEDGHGWMHLLDEVRGAVNPPPLIVADRLADAVLWAEVLNIGGYDLLQKPFDPGEVLHVVNAAWRSHNRKRVSAIDAPGLPKIPAVRAEAAAGVHGR